MTNNTMDKAIAVTPKLHITHATEVRQSRLLDVSEKLKVKSEKLVVVSF